MINLDNLSDDLKKKIQNLQNLQQSFEALTNQKLQYESEKFETQKAIEELEKASPEDAVYKSIGGILIKSNKDRLLDEKKSLNVTFEMKLKSLTQKLDRMKTEIETLRKSVQNELQNK